MAATRLIVPVEDDDGLESHVAQHFGRAPYFMVIDFENGDVLKMKAEPNTGEHMGGSGHPHEKLLALKPDVVAAKGMGPGGLQSFRNARVLVLKTDADHIEDVVEDFKRGKLAELNHGCEHAHHHEHTH